MREKNINAVNLGRLGGLAASRRKLTAEQVLEIRQSGGTYSDLAEIYGVSAVTICAIKNRRTWKWLADCQGGDENRMEG